MRFALVYGVLGIIFPLASGISRDKAELNLITNVLLKNYSKQVLPIVGFKKPVKVTIQLIIRRLVEVNEKHQFIVMYTGVMIKWNNPKFRWDPKEHMDIEHVHLQHDRVWVPDICLYNTLDESGNLAEKIDTAVKIYFKGNTTWLAPIQFKSECKIDVNYFPFDHQVCDLEFGSWTYDGNFIDIDPLSLELNFSQLVENPAWRIEDVLVMKKIGYYTQPYPSVIFRFVMKRRILYYLTNLVIPCVMISFLAFLSFCLPVQCGERIALVITMLLSMTVYMMLIFNFMPPSSEVIPLVSKFYLACIIEIALCLIASFFTIKWYYTEQPMPEWIYLLVNNCLASVLLFKKRDCGREYSDNSHSKDKSGHNELNDNFTSEGGVEVDEMVKYPAKTCAMFTRSTRRFLDVVSEKTRKDEEAKVLRKKWEYASKVVDRLFFLIFLVLFLSTVVLVLWTAADSEDQARRKALLKPQ